MRLSLIWILVKLALFTEQMITCTVVELGHVRIHTRST